MASKRSLSLRIHCRMRYDLSLSFCLQHGDGLSYSDLVYLRFHHASLPSWLTVLLYSATTSPPQPLPDFLLLLSGMHVVSTVREEACWWLLVGLPSPLLLLSTDQSGPRLAAVIAPSAGISAVPSQLAAFSTRIHYVAEKSEVDTTLIGEAINPQKVPFSWRRISILLFSPFCCAQSVSNQRFTHHHPWEKKSCPLPPPPLPLLLSPLSNLCPISCYFLPLATYYPTVLYYTTLSTLLWSSSHESLQEASKALLLLLLSSSSTPGVQ